LIGLYVSDHPLSPYQKTLTARVTHFSYQLIEASDKDAVIVAGMINRFRHHQTKKGDRMGFVTLEDMFGNIDLVIFPKVWEDVHHLMNIDQVLLVEGRIDTGQGDPKILVDSLTPVTLDELEDDTPNGDQGPPFELDDDLLEDYLPDLPFDEMPPPKSMDDLPGDHDGQTPAGISTSKENPISMDSDNTEFNPEEDVAENGEDEPAPLKEETPPSGPERIEQEQFSPKSVHVLKSPLPKPDPLPRVDRKPRCIYITLDSCGDKKQDVRRLRRIHDILVSRPGRDQFAFRVKENGFWYEINFPNVTTGLTDTLVQKLKGFLGDQNIDITQLP